MNRTIYFLLACLLLGLSSHAQAPGTTGQSADSTTFSSGHKMYRGGHYGQRNRDSLSRNYRPYAYGYGAGQGWQDSRRGGFPSHRHHDRGWTNHPRIAYTPEQRKQLQTIGAEYRQKSADLYKMDNLTLKEYKSRLLALNKEKKAKVEALLTPEQKTAIAKQRAQTEENQQVRAAAHLERLKIDLKLSDTQVAAIKSQQQNMRTQIQAIRTSDNLLPTEKKDQIRELAMKRKDALKTILTPEQYSELENMHTHRFSRS
jgi:hypothetical protein